MKTCHECDYCSDLYQKIDPLGEWKWCELHEEFVHEDDETCDEWEPAERIWPGEACGHEDRSWFVKGKPCPKCG